MEEKIYERQITKLSLSQRVVDEHQVERHFTSADLQELYAFKPDRLADNKEKPTLMLPKVMTTISYECFLVVFFICRCHVPVLAWWEKCSTGQVSISPQL